MIFLIVLSKYDFNPDIILSKPTITIFSMQTEIAIPLIAPTTDFYTICVIILPFDTISETFANLVNSFNFSKSLISFKLANYVIC